MKQYTIGEAITAAIDAGMKEPKVVFSSDCENAIAKAYYKAYNDTSNANVESGISYARRVMEEKE